MTYRSDTLSPPGGALLRFAQRRQQALWAVLAAILALALFLSTLQTGINGSVDAYATDVGEIQNALPRWGLIHRSGYPLYTASGSLFVTVLRLIGIEPAASTSLFSALWGAVAVGLLVLLAQELGISGPAALLGALAVAVSTAVWVFSSLAEVHTLTLVFSLGALLFAARFGRMGALWDLLGLAFFFSQGVMHQRSTILLAPAVLVWIWPQWHAVWQGLWPALGVSLLAPLTYLYMPLRVWTGATWVFGSPGTWEGFWLMVFDNRANRVVKSQADPEEWRRRLEVTLRILSDDMFWPLLVLGLAALVLLALRERGPALKERGPALKKRGPALKRRGWRDSLALFLAWAPNLALTYLIWRGRVVDAQLAAKLPILVMAGLGLAVLVDWAWQRSRLAGVVVAAVLTVALVAWGWQVRPSVLAITRDPSGKEIVEIAAQVADDSRPDQVRPTDGRPTDGQPTKGRGTTLVSTWGLDYWALAYAQQCRGELPGLNLVDHNADLRAIVERGDRLLIMSKILHVFPVPRWEKRLGPLYLASAAPGVVEIGPTPPVSTADVPEVVGLDLENGVRIRSASIEWAAEDQLLLTVYWEAVQSIADDYSVAVHLVAHDPPQGPADILTQADSVHPVDGWYPTSRWSAGEIVRDHYAIPVPAGSEPVSVRVALYRTDPQAGFVNSPWLSLPIPAH